MHQEILRTVEIIWKQLISQRRQALEDTYKMDLSVKGNDRERDMKLTEITPLWEEIMTKAWQHLIGLCLLWNAHCSEQRHCRKCST